MRKAYSNQRIILDNGVFYGFSLGYDFCAEHEWGIDGIKRSFGIDSSKIGVEGRSISKGEVFIYEDKKHILLRSKKPYGDKQTMKEATPYEGISGDLSTFWAEDSFAIGMPNTPENKKYLTELQEAFVNKDIVIAFLAPEMLAFSNASLCIMIKSKLPIESTNQMESVDMKRIKLLEYEEKLGITKLKEEAKKNGYKGEHYFCACSPNWISYEDPEKLKLKKAEMGTKYDIMFWVNYSDDDDNYGWYKAEDIIKWLSTPGLKLKSLNKKR